jgi:hypothetical protein
LENWIQELPITGRVFNNEQKLEEFILPPVIGSVQVIKEVHVPTTVYKDRIIKQPIQIVKDKPIKGWFSNIIQKSKEKVNNAIIKDLNNKINEL